jgi:hypothetical protein
MMNRLPLVGFEGFTIGLPALKIDRVGLYRNTDFGIKDAVVFCFKFLPPRFMVGNVVFETIIVFPVKDFGIVVTAPLFLHIEIID